MFSFFFNDIQSFFWLIQSEKEELTLLEKSLLLSIQLPWEGNQSQTLNQHNKRDTTTILCRLLFTGKKEEKNVDEGHQEQRGKSIEKDSSSCC